MALYPNGRYMTCSPGRHFGPAPGLDVYARGRGDRLNRFVGEQHSRTASTPDGYGASGIVPAIRPGSMSALRQVAALAEGASNLLQGGAMQGSAALMAADGSGSLSLVVSMTASATVVSLTGDGVVLSLTIGLEGAGSLSLVAAGGLSMIVPFDGVGAVAALAGTGDLRGKLSLQGGWTPFTDLSPEGLAKAVWERVIEAGFTAEQIVRILAAQAAGDGNGLEGASPQFTGLDGETVRLAGTYASGTRTITTRNGG